MWDNTSFLFFCRSYIPSIMDEKCLNASHLHVSISGHIHDMEHGWTCDEHISSLICGSDVSCVIEKGWKSLLIASLTRRDERDSIFRGRKTGVVHVCTV